MLHLGRIGTFVLAIILSLSFLLYIRPYQNWHLSTSRPARLPLDEELGRFDWSQRKQQYPVTKYHTLPKPSKLQLPRIQYDFASDEESTERKATRRQRMAQVKATMKRCWSSYRFKAWMQDELTPVTGTGKNTFGGWAATLVDSLDTLWIMNMTSEFREAVDAALDIDFSTSASADEINVFETNIRYLGGFISAYDLSGDERLLNKALEVANMLYAAFDTPNRMPVLRFSLHLGKDPELPQVPPSDAILAEMGSFSLEMTRLSQITKDPKWYDAAHRIMLIFYEQQDTTALPGLWPIQVDAEATDFSTGYLFSIAAWADSFYEYLPKMYTLLGGSDMYAKMFQSAADTAIRYNLYKPMIKQDEEIYMSGAIRVAGGQTSLQPELQHLVCYAGGMFALAGQLFRNNTHYDVGKKLTNGCVWAYKSTRTGVMPETSNLIPCVDAECEWSEEKWFEAVLKDASQADKENGTDAETIIKRDRLPFGFAAITDRRYRLRPEAIESLFVLYRVSGDKKLQETAWDMFRSIYTHTWTDLANADILDVTNRSAPRGDKMESFWTAETLKYFYLIFADADYISLDDYVFNTEAHPFRRLDSNLKSGIPGR